MKTNREPRKTMKNQPGAMKNQPGTMKTMKNQPGTMKNHEKPLFSYFFPFFPSSLQNIFKKNQKLKFFCWHVQFIENIFLLQCLKKEISTAKELDLRPLDKVIIFRDRQTNKQNLPIIYK